MDEKRAFAVKYVPHLRYDKREPFPLVAVGYTIFDRQGQSPSCSVVHEMAPGERVIEYALYFDFDIQHLYDLEHVFVKVDAVGAVIGVISSIHGKFFECADSGRNGV